MNIWALHGVNEMTKADVRKTILEKKRRVPELMLTQRSGIIEKMVTTLPEYKAAKTLLIYVSKKDEVETFRLIESAWQDGKEVAVPKVMDNHKDMRFITIDSFDHLKEGYFHVLEPEYGMAYDDPDPLVIMPGVAFDLKCHRIGYGKGFYDRFLSAHPDYKKIALSFDFALLSEVPHDEEDIDPDIIVTDRRIIRHS